jgi:hypothetical protein
VSYDASMTRVELPEMYDAYGMNGSDHGDNPLAELFGSRKVTVFTSYKEWGRQRSVPITYIAVRKKNGGAVFIDVNRIDDAGRDLLTEMAVEQLEWDDTDEAWREMCDYLSREYGENID